MITPFFALLFSIVTWIVAYNLQKRQPSYKVRMGRKEFIRFQKTKMAKVTDIRASNGGYVATFFLDEGKQVYLNADNELLNHGALPFDLFLFESSYSPEGYELPPPAIRYHDASSNGEDNNSLFAAAWSQVEIINQVRLVLFTTAFVVSFQAPHISFTISLVALFLSICFVKPISMCTIAGICGIIKTRKEQRGQMKDVDVSVAIQTKGALPKQKMPLPDVASDAEQFIRCVNMRMKPHAMSEPEQKVVSVEQEQLTPIQPQPSSEEFLANDSQSDEEETLQEDRADELFDADNLSDLNQGADPFGNEEAIENDTHLGNVYTDENMVYSDENTYEDVIPLDANGEMMTATTGPKESSSNVHSDTSQHFESQKSNNPNTSKKKSGRGKKSMTVLEAIQQ